MRRFLMCPQNHLAVMLYKVIECRGNKRELPLLSEQDMNYFCSSGVKAHL